MALTNDVVRDMVAEVRKRYPAWYGFAHPRFRADEIRYKRTAAKRAACALSETDLRSLIESSDWDAFIARLKAIAGATNLLYLCVPSEGDLAVIHSPNLMPSRFCHAVYDLLHGPGDGPERIGRYAKFAKETALPMRWPFPTYYPFLLNPAEEMFVKPSIMRRFLKKTGDEEKYGAKPSGDTYRLILERCHQLRDALAEFGPTDMVDIQGFLWAALRDKEGDHLTRVRREVEQWEKAKPGYIAQFANLLLRPFIKGLESATPDWVQERAGAIVETALEKLATAADGTFDQAEVKNRAQDESDNCGDWFHGADHAAQHYWHWHVVYGLTEGGLAGGFGWPGLIADLPALMTILVRVTQEIGTCYGYDITKEEERAYVIQVVMAGMAADVKAKAALVMALKDLEQTIITKGLAKGTALGIAKQGAKMLGIQLTKRKALQMIPVVGAVIGAGFNALMVNDVAEAAYMSYRRRKLAEIDKPEPPQARAAHGAD